ncbi:41113_t:CDS:2, partial [Gigaspora margarita]
MSKENKDARKPEDTDFFTKVLHDLDKKSDQIEKCEKERKTLPTDPLDKLQKICARQNDIASSPLKESQTKAIFSNLSKDTRKLEDNELFTKAFHDLDKKSDQIEKCEKEKKEIMTLPTDPLDQLQKISARQNDLVSSPLKELQTKAIFSNLSKGQTEGLIMEKNSSQLIETLEAFKSAKDKTMSLPLRPPSAKFSGLKYPLKSASSVGSNIEYFEKLASKVIPINEEKTKPIPLSAVQPKFEKRKSFSLPNALDASNFFVNQDYSTAFLKNQPSEDKKILKTTKKSLSFSNLSKSETVQHSISAINELTATTTISQPDKKTTSLKDEVKLSTSNNSSVSESLQDSPNFINQEDSDENKAVANIASMLNLPRLGIKDLYYDIQQHIDKKSQDFFQIGPLFSKVECMYHPLSTILQKDPRINGSFITFSNIEHTKNPDVNNWFEEGQKIILQSDQISQTFKNNRDTKALSLYEMLNEQFIVDLFRDENGIIRFVLVYLFTKKYLFAKLIRFCDPIIQENVDLASYRLEKIADYRKKDLLVIINKDKKKDFEEFGYKTCSEIWVSDAKICENNILLCKKVGFTNDDYSISKTRNIGIIAHIDAGTTECMLYYSRYKEELE